MIDAYEQKHGPVEDRTIFDGEIIVPPHLRNMSLSSLRASRVSLFGSLSRSRTFLNFSQNARHTFHGSVPDLSRNHFTFSSANSSNNNVDSDDVDENERCMSSTSTITKITMNSSTTLTFSDESSGTLSNGDERTQYSSDGPNTTKSDEGYKSNSIRSLNDIHLRESASKTMTTTPIMSLDDRTKFCQSLGRPNRSNRTQNIYVNDFKKDLAQTKIEGKVEGYMTLIKTNPQKSQSTSLNAYRSSANQPISPLCTVPPMHESFDSSLSMSTTSSTSTFQRNKQPLQSNNNNYGQIGGAGHHRTADFTGQLSLESMTKFKLPRVTLNHSTATNPSSQQ